MELPEKLMNRKQVTVFDINFVLTYYGIRTITDLEYRRESLTIKFRDPLLYASMNAYAPRSLEDRIFVYLDYAKPKLKKKKKR